MTNYPSFYIVCEFEQEGDTNAETYAKDVFMA